MAKDRITDQTIVADFSDGDVLYGSDVNKIIKVFKEGINKNKIDLNRILTGSEYFYIADDLSGLTALISEQVPSDGQRGYIFDGQENQGNLEIYLYNELAGVWDFLQKTSINSPFADSITISNTAGLSQDDLNVIGKILYDNERHTLCYLTDLGDIVEIGNTLGNFGKNHNGTTYIGQPVVLTGVQEVDAVKEFVSASAASEELSTMVGVLTSSFEGGVLNPNEVGKITVFGDIDIPDFKYILDLTFLDDLGIDFIKDIPFGTKLYLSAEAGKYSAVMPSKPNQAIWVATVLDIKPNNSGRIFVFPQRLRLDGGVDIQTSDTQPTDQAASDFWYDTSGMTGGVGSGYESGGEGNSYEPDGVTIVLNEEGKLKVSKNLVIDGGDL